MVRVLVCITLIACGAKHSGPVPAPVVTPPEQYGDTCKSCDGTSYCDLMVGAGAAGGTPATTGGCVPLPESCRGETDCRCFGNLKGCHCSHTARGYFVVECPAP